MLDFILLLICLAGLVAVFICPVPAVECICLVMGILGTVYCAFYLWRSVFCPIKRDRLLIKGNFLMKVMNFVLFVPFVITFFFRMADPEYSPKNLVFEENLYHDEVTEVVDTLFLCDSARTQILKSELPLHRLEIEQDSLLTENVKLPESIREAQVDPPLFWTVYYHFIDPGNQHMTTSVSGRRRAALISILGVLLLNGLLISTLINWFDRRKERWYNGEIRYGAWALWRKRYAVVIGADESAPTIVKRLLKGRGESAGVHYVILLTNESVRTVRERIASYLSEREARRLIIYNGQLDSAEEIYRMRIGNAVEIYVLGENSGGAAALSYHDTQNMRCVHNLAGYLTDKCVERKIVCRVMFEYQTTYSVFQFSDLPDNIKEHLVFIPFNRYENWAQCVFVKGEYTETVKKVLPALRKIDLKPTRVNTVLHPLVNALQSVMPKDNDMPRTISYRPLDGDGIGTDSREHVHLVVVGMSKMGIAMAIQAAQLAHYPNFRQGKDGVVDEDGKPLRTRITFIDTNADREMDFFMGRYQNLFDLSLNRYVDASEHASLDDVEWHDPMTNSGSRYSYLGENFIDIEWEFIKGSVEQPSVMRYLEEIAEGADPDSGKGHSILTVAICLPLAHEAIAAGIYLPNEVYDRAQQILIYQREASDIVYNLYFDEGDDKYKRYSRLRPFGMQYADFTMDKESYWMSQLCNYAYDLILDEDVDNSAINSLVADIGDASDRAAMSGAREKWKRLSVFNKWSNRYLSNSFGTKLRSIGCGFKGHVLHYDVIRQRLDAHIEDMARCEHNRWNVQQLLMGLRAYTDSESYMFRELRKNAAETPEAQEAYRDFKERMKSGPEKVHLNICPYEYLDSVDPAAKGYDRVLCSVIPEILKVVGASRKKV